MMTVTKTYNHAFCIGFEVAGSTHPEGEDVTPAQLREALLRRVRELGFSDEWLEACGAPFDTYEEENEST